MKNVVLKFIYWVLARYARIVIAKHKPFIVGVTGSVGKSSTKEAIWQVLADHFGEAVVRKNYGNLNAEIGIPLTILGYKSLPSKLFWPVLLVSAYFRTLEKDYPKYLVMEIGIEHKGDMQYFGSIIQPDIAVITSASGAHLSNFKDLAEYQKEKQEIISEAKKDALIIVCVDDGSLSSLDVPNLTTYGIENKSADFKAEDIKLSLKGTEYRICSLGQKIAVKSHLLGQQFVYAELAAFVVGHKMGMQSLAIKKSLEKLVPLNGRMNLLKSKMDGWIIDDTYNSNPTSLMAALDVLSKIDYPYRKVAIIGNMNELGSYEERAHSEIANYAKKRADVVVFAGKNATLMTKIFADEKNSYAFSTREELLDNIIKIVKPKDLILIKASQNKNYFEEVTKKLMLESEKAGDLLVRQSNEWLRKK